ncbi:hypothetical protein BH10CHL1_BH10CHL1_50450 [soil metagenome]
MELRAQMKADLLQAMKARQTATVSTLRSVLAAIDNAEAVPVSEPTQPVEPVMGQQNEVPRKLLSVEDIRQIIQRELDERHAASLTYIQLGEQAEAGRLQREVALLFDYLNR